ncbi:ABC transporter ATP-binding protein [Tessaracoccus sp. G1721]
MLTNLRVVFTLVPWRLRPKLIATIIGSTVLAFLDMTAVLLILPIMQILSGATAETSPVLKAISTLTGVEDPRMLLIVTLVSVVTLMVAKNLYGIWFRWWQLGLMATAQSDATHEMMTLYTTSPWIHHRRRSSDSILQAMNVYITTAFSGVTTGVISLVVDFITITALLAALFILSPVVTLVALVFFGGSALIIQAVLKTRILDLAERTRQEHMKSWSYLSPAVDGLKEVRLNGATEEFTHGYSDTRRNVAHMARTTTILNELPRYLLEIIMILGIILTALVLFATTNQADAFAFLAVFAVAAVRLIPTLNRVVATVGVIRTNTPNLVSLVEEINTLRSESGRQALTSGHHHYPRADIEFRDVRFQFPDASTPVLDAVSGVIPAGRTVALVGTSGAGKTTFVELLLALFEPDSGTMEVAGVSIHQYPTSWRQQLGVVTQDVYLLDRSIRQNVAFGVAEEDIDDQRVAQAVRMAQLEDFVEQMPQGLETVVGYRGARVSGGQKQRIGIARALYRMPQVLILDEATSALDNETESRITETIQALQGTITIIVVAHRLSTVKHADQILFFSDGRIAARGTMSELESSNAEFAKLVKLGRLT